MDSFYNKPFTLNTNSSPHAKKEVKEQFSKICLLPVKSEPPALHNLQRKLKMPPSSLIKAKKAIKAKQIWTTILETVF